MEPGVDGAQWAGWGQEGRGWSREWAGREEFLGGADRAAAPCGMGRCAVLQRRCLEYAFGLNSTKPKATKIFLLCLLEVLEDFMFTPVIHLELIFVPAKIRS